MRNECPICFSTKIKRDNGDYKCERCQHVFPDKTNLEPPSPPTSGSNAFKPDPEPMGGLMGWICPVCGRGLSPYTDSCPCTVKWEITCGTGTAVPFGIQKSAEEVGSALKTLHDKMVMDGGNSNV